MSFFTVFIETGLHAGAVQRLEPGLYTIGSELDSDIVLSDPDVESVHAILEFDESGLRLEPAKGKVSVHGETGQLEPGDERYLSLPAGFSIGDTAISIRAPKDVVRTRNRQRYAIGAMAAAVIGVVGLYTVGPLSDTFSPAPPGQMADDKLGPAATETADSRSIPAPSALDAEDAGSPLATGPDSDPAVTGDMAAAALRDQLTEASLSSIDVIVKKDHLVAKGTADPEQMSDWQSIQMWFDGEYGRDVSLVPDVAAAEEVEPPQLAIEAIWAGDDPYIMAGGRRYFEGARIGDGWAIEQIRPEQITLRRGDQSFSITL